MRSKSKVKETVPVSSPFGETGPNRRVVSLWMLLFSLVVFAGISMLIMLATRVPLIANAINDFLGLPHMAKPDKPDRTTHLIFLLFCYSSPLLLALWVGLLRSLHAFFANRTNMNQEEPDSPFV